MRHATSDYGGIIRKGSLMHEDLFQKVRNRFTETWKQIKEQKHYTYLNSKRQE
jgi:hypothetical protein